MYELWRLNSCGLFFLVFGEDLSPLSLPEVQQPQPKQVEEPPLSDKDRQALLLELAECMVSDMDALR